MEQDPNLSSSTRPGQFSLTSIFVFMIVFSSLSLSLGYFYRSFEDKQYAMGQFIVINAMAPLVTLTAVSLLFRLLRKN
jgi:hypothetical protein